LKKVIYIVVICLFGLSLLIGCDRGGSNASSRSATSPVTHVTSLQSSTVSTEFPNPSKLPSEPPLPILLLDVTPYQNDLEKQNMILTINHNAQAINERNRDHYYDTFGYNSKKNAKGAYDYWAQDIEATILKLEDAKFKSLYDNQTEVYVKTTYREKNADPVESTTQMFHFVQSSGKWNLEALD
jgi:hypothetical protein